MSVPKWQVRKDRQGGSSTQTQASMRRYLSYTSWKFKLTDLPSEITQNKARKMFEPFAMVFPCGGPRSNEMAKLSLEAYDQGFSLVKYHGTQRND